MFDRNLDAEIATVGLRIGQRKRLIAAEVEGVASALRDNVTSSTALLVAIGVGFALGRVSDGKAAQPGQARAGQRLLSVVDAVRAALKVIRTPTLIWAARLLGMRHAPGGAPAARPERQSPQSYPR